MKIIIKNKLSDKNSLIKKKGYSKANSEADIIEKKKYPKGYKQLKKDESKLGKHEIMGKIKGKNIEVEKKFKPYAKEIALHDEVEKKRLRKERNEQK